MHPGSIPGEASILPDDCFDRRSGRLLRGIGMALIDFQAARVKMVDGQLRTTDVTRHEVLTAFLEIPRETFVPASKQELAYLDDDIEVAPGRYLMEPSPLAKLIQLADIASGDKVLIVGAGNGYGAAVVSKIAAKVVAVEENGELAATAATLLSAVGVSNVELVVGALTVGALALAPFDAIFIEGSVSSVPQALFGQLAEGGRLVAVIGEGHTGVAKLHTKSGNTVSSVRGFNVAVKPLPGFAAKAEFAF